MLVLIIRQPFKCFGCAGIHVGLYEISILVRKFIVLRACKNHDTGLLRLLIYLVLHMLYSCFTAPSHMAIAIYGNPPELVVCKWRQLGVINKKDFWLVSIVCTPNMAAASLSFESLGIGCKPAILAARAEKHQGRNSCPRTLSLRASSLGVSLSLSRLPTPHPPKNPRELARRLRTLHSSNDGIEDASVQWLCSILEQISSTYYTSK